MKSIASHAATTVAVALSIALFAPAAPVEAGDWNNGAGGMKDHGGRAAVAVPAPKPITENFHYYLRADAGVSFLANKPSYDESGITFGQGDIFPLLATSAVNFARGYDKVNTPFGVGVGMYVSPRWRAELTMDWRTKQAAKHNGTFSYRVNRDSGNTADTIAGTPPVTTTHALSYSGAVVGQNVTGAMSERVETRNTVLLANAYYDLTERGRITPYVGAGLGLVHTNYDREFNSYTDAPVISCGQVCLERRPGKNGSVGGAETGMAAALMAGVGISLDHRMAFDLNYRLLYTSGFGITTPIVNGASTTTMGESRLNVGGSLEHHLRAGVRMNIW